MKVIATSQRTSGSFEAAAKMRFIGRVVFGKTHVAINPEQRLFTGYGINVIYLFHFGKKRIGKGDAIFMRFLILVFVFLKPLAVIVVFKRTKKFKGGFFYGTHENILSNDLGGGLRNFF